MKNSTLKKANHIKESLKAIDKLRYIMRVPYPSINDGDKEISFVCLDETTRTLIKRSILEILDKREQDLYMEFDIL